MLHGEKNQDYTPPKSLFFEKSLLFYTKVGVSNSKNYRNLQS